MTTTYQPISLSAQSAETMRRAAQGRPVGMPSRGVHGQGVYDSETCPVKCAVNPTLQRWSEEGTGSIAGTILQKKAEDFGYPNVRQLSADQYLRVMEIMRKKFHQAAGSEEMRIPEGPFDPNNSKQMEKAIIDLNLVKLWKICMNDPMVVNPRRTGNKIREWLKVPENRQYLERTASLIPGEQLYKKFFSLSFIPPEASMMLPDIFHKATIFAFNGDLAAMKPLIVDSKSASDALESAVISNQSHIIDFLLDPKRNPHQVDRRRIRQILELAALNGAEKTFKHVLFRANDLQTADLFQLLTNAARNGNVEIVKCILKDLLMRDLYQDEFDSVLAVSVSNEQQEVVKLLMQDDKMKSVSLASLAFCCSNSGWDEEIHEFFSEAYSRKNLIMSIHKAVATVLSSLAFLGSLNYRDYRA